VVGVAGFADWIEETSFRSYLLLFWSFISWGFEIGLGVDGVGYYISSRGADSC